MAEVKEILSGTNICPAFQRMVFTRGSLYLRAQEIAEELRQGVVKPFDELVLHFGDPHAFGQSPITFLRQLLKVLICPELLDYPRLPQDVKDKAKRILQATPGFDIDTLGMKIIREDVARYISERDGHPADPEFIILTSGGAQGIQVGLQSIATNCKESERRTGLMLPIPAFSHYLARSLEYNFYQIRYYLDQDANWTLNIKELKRALDEASPHCEPRALVLINPGNPTGQTLTYDQIRDVITFCARERLILFADEVYQDTVFTEEVQFHSCKKVLRDMGPEYKKFQLMSINSASKGFYGECGLRGAYLELAGFSKEVKEQFRTKLSANTCPTVIGQVAVEAICNPPQPGDESYETFIEEKNAILNSYQRKAKLTTSVLNSLEGVKCTEITGSLYAYPRLFLPQKAIEAAKLKNIQPDHLYCWELLEETGVFVISSGSFGGKAGSYYFRITILPSEEKMALMLDRIKRFHKMFMRKYRDEKNELLTESNKTHDGACPEA